MQANEIQEITFGLSCITLQNMDDDEDDYNDVRLNFIASPSGSEVDFNMTQEIEGVRPSRLSDRDIAFSNFPKSTLRIELPKCGQSQFVSPAMSDNCSERSSPAAPPRRRESDPSFYTFGEVGFQ